MDPMRPSFGVLFAIFNRFDGCEVEPGKRGEAAEKMVPSDGGLGFKGCRDGDMVSGVEGVEWDGWVDVWTLKVLIDA